MRLHHLISYPTSSIILLPWDTSFNTNYDYSSSDTVATRKSALGSGNQDIRSVDTLVVTSSNKFYVEVFFDNSVNDTNVMAGVFNSSQTSTGSPFSAYTWNVNGSGFIQHNFANLPGGPHTNAGNQGYTFAFALDCNDGKIWFGKDAGPGSTQIDWWGTPGTSGHAYTLPSDTYYVGALTSAGASNKAVTLRANSSTQLYTAPSGFSAMST